MSKERWRDDSFLNRLRIFLKQKGDLDVTEIIPFKKNIFKIYANGQWWITKCFHENNKDKLWSLFAKLKNQSPFVGFIPFPNGKKWLDDVRDQKWCLMPFRNGTSFSFQNKQDREDAIHLLNQFHQETKGLKISDNKRRSYMDKLEQRYKKFVYTKDVFTRLGLILPFNKMDKQLREMLLYTDRLHWENLEKKARRRKTIIHGDSASHNFIRNHESGSIHLIDFDLVHYAPYVYEWIQLAQRFLFDGVQSIEELYEYPVFRQFKNDAYFHYGTLFPSDLIREWLHFLRRAETRRDLYEYIHDLDELWNKRVSEFYKKNHYDIISHNRKKEEINAMNEQIDQLTNWLKEQVKEAGVHGLIVGISGGLDSAVVAHLIKQACPNNSLGVIMPCKSNADDSKHAEMVVKSSNIESITIDLTEAHEILFKTIKETTSNWNDEQEKLADANLRARLRMSTLYTLATNYKYLVVGTDNAAEWYTGYFTKYGDGGVDLVPLVHYTKGEVRELAKALGVPNEIISKPPSAGLWEGQTDENEMGTTYDMIDKFIRGEEIPSNDKEIIERMHHNTQHKRELAKKPPKFDS